MSPRTRSATKQQLATKEHFKGVQKKRKLIPQRKTIRSRVVRASSPSAVNTVLSEPFQELSAASQELTYPPRLRGRKRRNDTEDRHTGKRQSLRTGLQEVSEFSQPLSKENLYRHNRLTGSGASDNMDPGTPNSERRGLKRHSSRLSSVTDTDQDTTSIRSQASCTAARYRFNVLQYARIFIRPGPPPEEVQTRINGITQCEISEERKCQLSHTAETLCNDFIKVLGRPSREDDCIEPIHRALSLMDGGGKLDFLRKADWDPSLKPIASRVLLDVSFLHKSKTDPGGSAAVLRKPQQVETPSPTSDPSQPAMSPPPPPPPALPTQEILHVKTPRPDITAGPQISTVVNQMVKQGFGEVKANSFLQDLQQQQILCSDPTQQAHSICFPPIVIEGKSYATGKPVFEAQNQASVSGSCMLNMQLRLAELAESASPGSHPKKMALAFSICTEGPHFELWAHYTTSQESVQNYNMSIVKTCHASIPAGVADFVMVMENVMRWASGDFVNDIVEQLVLVERATRGQPVP